MLKKIIKRSFLLLVFAVIVVFVATFATRGARQAIVPLVSSSVSQDNSAISGAGSLRVMTLNIAHGRKKAYNQLFLSSKKIKENLSDIATFVRPLNLDVIAFQEADGISFWSGGFDHINHLRKLSNFEYSSHGLHVDGLKIRYGTALLTRGKPIEPFSFTFDATPPTFSKGFVVATITWPGDSEFQVDVISVHLDYSRSYIQKTQIKQMLRFLRKRKRPAIIMGDFNIDWNYSDGVAYKILKSRKFTTVNESRLDQITFPGTGRRLDWIFVTPELIIKDERILKYPMSDHYAVIATIHRKPEN